MNEAMSRVTLRNTAELDHQVTGDCDGNSSGGRVGRGISERDDDREKGVPGVFGRASYQTI